MANYSKQKQKLLLNPNFAIEISKSLVKTLLLEEGEKKGV
ncbi:hypothetical protein MNB_SM-7-66 [hydrothermal vent metagenome]|uniref:Uncharacterized protein n=1 Tax=hydrothermal vent metagenome TaxID=652676 RepID=A0A1W1C092_9ZZZZ